MIAFHRLGMVYKYVSVNLELQHPAMTAPLSVKLFWLLTIKSTSFVTARCSEKKKIKQNIQLGCQ